MTGSILVAAAVLIQDEQVMIVSRPEGKPWAGYYEFPGGKVEPHERPEQALSRELQEELNITVAQADLTPLTFLSHLYPEYAVVVLVYACYIWQGEPQPIEKQDIIWVNAEQMHDYPLLPSNQILTNRLRNLLQIMKIK
jgi:8-oxo-dGTP diphosphatase